MNTPPYIVVDAVGAIAAAVREALDLPVLNYQYGYVTELNETLKQYSASPEFAAQKFPLLWLQQPFTVVRDVPGYYGRTTLRLFVINASTPTMKAQQRMDVNFKPILYPIYGEVLQQIRNSTVLTYDEAQPAHEVTDRYYWGEEQQSVLNDVVDCLEINRLALRIQDNLNCLPFKSF